jgi:AraC-like DNA-binding protein
LLNIDRKVDSVQYSLSDPPYAPHCDPKDFRWKAFSLGPARLCLAGLFSHPDKIYPFSYHFRLLACPGLKQGCCVREVGTPIGLRYYVPAPSLRSVVSSYYIFHADLPHYTDVMRADLPQLRFVVRGSAIYDFLDGRRVPAPRISLLGPTFGAYRFDATGPLLVLGIGLQPAGWGTLIREDASVYANRIEDAEPLFGEILLRVLGVLEGMDRHPDMIAVADQLMGALMMRVPEPNFWFTSLTDQWLASSRSPEVDALIGQIGMSTRQVERLAKRTYGAPPKLLARKYRALRTAAQLSKGAQSWTDVAGDIFSDQSHFIREFRQFVGVTPNQLVARPPLVMRLSLERRRAIQALPELTQIT